MLTVYVGIKNAASTIIKPAVIYPGTQFKNFDPSDVWPESFICKSKNGWINQEFFALKLRKVFVPEAAEIKKPVLLVEGHVSHQSMKATDLHRKWGHPSLCTSPYKPHIAAVGRPVFKTMKAEWRSAIKNYTGQTNQVVTKTSFAGVFKDAFDNTVAKKPGAVAIKKSGIFPPDLSAVDISMVLKKGDPTQSLGHAAALGVR